MKKEGILRLSLVGLIFTVLYLFFSYNLGDLNIVNWSKEASRCLLEIGIIIALLANITIKFKKVPTQ